MRSASGERTDVRNCASLADRAEPSVTGRVSRQRARARLTSAVERRLPSRGCFAGSSRRRPMTPPTRPIRRPRPWPARPRPANRTWPHLPVVGITRRRAAILLGALLAGWIIILFARQVSEASAATGRAEEMVASNAARRSEIAGLERELQRIQQQRLRRPAGAWLRSRRTQGDRLHTRRERRASARAHAPGSAGLRVGALTSSTPLESWLTLLFGPGD